MTSENKNPFNVPPFDFMGEIPASKSVFNRALIIQSFNQKIELNGQSECDDVVKMKSALESLDKGQTLLDCGEAGTVLRFLAFRVSRLKGSFLLSGKPRLFLRPQMDLIQTLEQLNVKSKLTSMGLEIQSNGWSFHNPIKVNAAKSSQFLSGILLSSWNLEKDLEIVQSEEKVSETYAQMTLNQLKEFGFQCYENNSKLIIPSGQTPKRSSNSVYRVESDISSVAAVAALAATSGEAHFLQYPFNSQQPDQEFLNAFSRMGIFIKQINSELHIKKSFPLNSIDFNLKNCPDLFLIMAALAASAKGTSHFYGAPQLKYKETNRLLEAKHILVKLGVPITINDDGATIEGTNLRNQETAILDAKEDHRLVMMGVVLKSLGFKLKIENTESVRKSFPEFLQIAKNYLI